MKYILAVTFLALSSHAFAQDYRSEFNTAFQSGDTTRQKETLAKWEAADPKNAELFTSYFNYFFQKSRKEVLSLTKQEPQGKSLALHDSTGIKGYMGSEIIFDSKILQRAFDKIDQGIKLYPDRLDMRFGKIYVLGQVKEWKKYTDEIITTIHHSAKNKNKWTWTNNIKKEDGENFFIGALQDYQVKLYNTGDDSLLPYMRSMAEEVLKLHPNNVENLSNVGITYMVTEKYDEAIKAFLRAEKIAPTDAIVLGNLGHAYKLKGEKTKAIEYYQKVIDAGDQNMIEYAKKQIEELKKL
jgi:tetratricopeptide (TPR) repeat protein